MVLMYIEPHLSNIQASIHEKVKQQWGWVEKKCCLYKMSLHKYIKIYL